MADEPRGWHHEDANAPENPPQSVLQPKARRAALMSYLGPVIALFVVVGIALIYWMNRGPVSTDERTSEEDAIGTAGADSPGGFDPAPEFSETRDETAFRGADDRTSASAGDAVRDATFNSIAGVLGAKTTGRAVTLTDVEVESVEGNMFWVSQDGQRIAVTIPGDATVKEGAAVDVTGMTESDDRGGVRIRASRVQ